MTDTAASIDTYGAARAAVAAGTDPVDAARALVAAMTPEEQLGCLDGDAPTWAGLAFIGTGGYHRMPFGAARVERLGVPGFAFADGPRGVVVGNATCFPVTMGRGATWDPELEERVGDAIGRELRATGADLYGGVCVNLLRHPAWGRAQETYGEDPYHVGEMGAALVRGVQRHAMACVKHYAANSIENARFQVDVEVDDVALHEVYLAQFRRIVDEGVACVMSAYNAVNGEWCGESRALLTDVLRDEWGFGGFVISDWIFGLRDAARSVAAGLDVEMPYRMVRAPRLPAALDDGSADWSDVADAVTRVVATRLRFAPVLDTPPPDRAVIGSPEHRALAREVAARSVVLLRNEAVEGSPVLPLDAASRPSVAVLGRLAAEVNLGDGGSSDVWALDAITVLDGLRAALAGSSITHDAGDDPDRAATVAAAHDLAVVVVGSTHEDEGEFIGDTGPELAALFPGPDDPDLAARYEAEIAAWPEPVVPPHVAARPSAGFSTGGDRTSLRLRDEDVALVRAVAAANPRTVVVIQGGSAVLTDEWDRDVAAVAVAFYGGSEAGTGLGDVLVGAVAPSGRLPFSIPAAEDHLPDFDRDATRAVYDRWHGWWRLERDGHPPAYPFGFGLSYTELALDGSDARVDGDAIVVTATVANTGDHPGADVVQVYARLPDPEAPRRMVGFGRVEVPPGASAPVSVRIPTGRLATRDPDRRSWVPPAGTYDLMVARHVADRDARHHTVQF